MGRFRAGKAKWWKLSSYKLNYMCGIAGCIGIDDTTTIELMLDAFPHRGPDDRGIHVYGPFVFGHTCLSIVDVTKGHQPIPGDVRKKRHYSQWRDL